MKPYARNKKDKHVPSSNKKRREKLWVLEEKWQNKEAKEKYGNKNSIVNLGSNIELECWRQAFWGKFVDVEQAKHQLNKNLRSWGTTVKGNIQYNKWAGRKLRLRNTQTGEIINIRVTKSGIEYEN